MSKELTCPGCGNCGLSNSRDGLSKVCDECLRRWSLDDLAEFATSAELAADYAVPHGFLRANGFYVAMRQPEHTGLCVVAYGWLDRVAIIPKCGVTLGVIMSDGVFVELFVPPDLNCDDALAHLGDKIARAQGQGTLGVSENRLDLIAHMQNMNIGLLDEVLRAELTEDCPDCAARLKTVQNHMPDGCCVGDDSTVTFEVLLCKQEAEIATLRKRYAEKDAEIVVLRERYTELHRTVGLWAVAVGRPTSGYSDEANGIFAALDNLDEIEDTDAVPRDEDYPVGRYVDGAPLTDDTEAQYIIIDRWGGQFIGQYVVCSLADYLPPGYWSCSCGAGLTRVYNEDIVKHALINIQQTEVMSNE